MAKIILFGVTSKFSKRNYRKETTPIQKYNPQLQHVKPGMNGFGKMSGALGFTTLLQHAIAQEGK